MAELGYGAQIVNVTEDHRFVMDEHALGEVLLREDIKDLPVVLVSVAGAYRGGKSFLLNFFLRYLNAPVSAREDGSWIQGETLEGFSWRSGSTRNTTGILIWSQPFICNITPQKKVAVLLMDTQGTFDSQSTIADCSNVFALSTLLCSVQLYNVMQNIQEDHLHHLHLFTEYGRMIHDKGHGKAFQILTFLVRDWQNPWEYAYGTAGGNRLLESRLQVHRGMAEELQTVRQHIRSCFDDVSCFLMPHPGLGVPTNPHFRGELNIITSEFKTHLLELVNSIFGPQNLLPKVVNGREIKAQELFTYFKSYMSIFSSGQMPSTSSIMKVTTEANLLNAIREIAAQYEENMENECGKHTPCVPPVDIKVLHERYRRLAKDNYSSRRLMGSKDTIKSYRDKLSKDLDDRAEKYFAVNETKRRVVIDSSRTAYNDKIKEYHNHDDIICVHPADLETIHEGAKTIALGTFDSLMRRVTNEKDVERDNFIRTLNNDYDLVKRNNERSNTQLVNDLRMSYWDHMQPSIMAVPPLFPSQLQAVHEAGLETALQSFRDRRRCLANSYPSDEYRDRLLTAINEYFNDARTMNESVNGRAMNAAVAEYREQVTRNWNYRSEHLHPQELRDIDAAARTVALNLLYGNRLHSHAISDEDRNNVERMFTARYTAFEETNTTMNNEAIQSAYNLFVSTLEEQRRAKWYWIFIVPIAINVLVDMLGGFFKHSKALAITEFYKNRKNTGLERTDNFYQELMRKINEHDPWHLFSRGIRVLLDFLRDRYGINIPFF